jgi:hypothetical protein
MAKLSVNLILIGARQLRKMIKRIFVFLLFQVYQFITKKLEKILSDCKKIILSGRDSTNTTSSCKVCPAVIRLQKVVMPKMEKSEARNSLTLWDSSVI